MAINSHWPGVGPINRYKYALFVEKEGFDTLVEQSGIRERYDMMAFSTKGMSVTSARQLVEALSVRGVTILVAHDFDVAGLTICHTLGHDTRRYKFKTEPNVINIGLRLNDVREMALQSEPVQFGQKKDPREKFKWGDDNYIWPGDYDVTDEELDFLVERPGWVGPSGYDRGWHGKRVELNAMTSPQFIAWLEGKFAEHGVGKVLPDEETLALAWCRARRITAANRAIAKLLKKVNEDDCTPPPDLAEQIQKQLKVGKPESWDEILLRLAEKSLK
jgi:hypothetical protein